MKNKEEKIKFLAWEKLDPFEQHMILMYFYRTDTIPVNELEFYIETYWFRKFGIKREDLPQWFLTLSPKKLRQVAYDIINQKVPEEDKELA